ncbi:DUF4334 domain-containing protein [Nonomuraea sp. SYSU D8015]|uniref:DUF4334 domain-containing protein n=1 Tax=Nonomuraea sp. SYSU D8015 TaxID=2593644 RepID=UPI001CB6B73D|nr:DUF4334 domain-containing protein [Nonomuraea sp. SYSU D8015]
MKNVHMDAEKARARFKQLRNVDGEVSPQELDEIWTALDVVRPEQILGQWQGSEFVTGHPLNGRLGQVSWYGKTFISPKDAKPLICHAEDGTLYSNTEMGNGEATLWMVEFRGEVTATMVYDGQPIFDHFKKVDDNTLMGIMNGKDVPDEGPFFYFVLDRA